MPSNNDPHDASRLPPIGELVRGRPTSWQGMEISWSSSADPVPLFLGRFATSERSEGVEAYLFAARYELSEARCAGESLGEGFFEEYFVVCRGRQRDWDVHRLLQRRSVTFSESEDEKDYVPVNSLRKVRDRWASQPPKWESAEEAVWPMSHDEPMVFLGQVRLGDRESIRDSFTWGMTVYLFWARRDRGEFKVVTQDCGAQTPKEHYASEDS